MSKTNAAIAAQKYSQPDLQAKFRSRIRGQPDAAGKIVPYIEMYQAGLAPEGRPAGVFILLGPTGTGKTKTVEAVAEILHGSEKNILKIDCGEFQMEHEVAKLIGAPPGYLGHRETSPALTQQKLNAVTSEQCDLSLVLFDEVEKAAPSMTRLLMGILDKGTLRLGDNSLVNFERSLIFFTSNLGAKEMQNALTPKFGFRAAREDPTLDEGYIKSYSSKLEEIGLQHLRNTFSPEFVNRIDVVVTYRPLSSAALSSILDKKIRNLQDHVNTRLSGRSFGLEVPDEARRFLLAKGTSLRYGARELDRTIHRYLTQPLATLVAHGRISPGSLVRMTVDADGQRLKIRKVHSSKLPHSTPPTVLVVDDNRDLLQFIQKIMSDAGWTVLVAENVAAALEIASTARINAALLDFYLPIAENKEAADMPQDGVELGIKLRADHPHMKILMMTGAEMDSGKKSICEEQGYKIFRKPFNISDIMRSVRKFTGSRAAEAEG